MQTETRYDSRMETDQKYHEEYDVMSGTEDFDFGVDDCNGSLLPFPEHHPTSQISAPRAIPKAQPPAVSNQGIAPSSASQPSSAGSTASAFLNNLMDPAASTFNSTHFSHTPPSQVSTSYEASHFAKRARSGSVSERVKISTELERKGMIDRETKGILKDLIISGQDDELQHALDRYEQGDTALLETILQNGSLSSKAKNEIDLLGDLDLDFLTVNDPVLKDSAGQNIVYAPGTKTMGQAQGEASDGIGDLDFDGGISGSDSFGTSTNYRIPSPMYIPSGSRSRSNSTFSVDLGLDYRSRSNSLFSALIGSVTPQQASTPVEYGNWMGGHQQIEKDAVYRNGVMIQNSVRRSSAPNMRSNLSLSIASEDKRISSAERKEIKAEEKRRERSEKKELKEKEKREKKEKREQAKLDKVKQVEIEDTEEHEPGSGRPRSLSDPNLRTSIDPDGLLHVDRPDGWIGAYSPESRKVRIDRFLSKRNHRVWTKTVKYDVRKNFADSRLRVKGRFVKKEDELLMRELMSLT